MAPKEFTFEQLRIDDLPPFNADDENKPSAAVRRLKGKIGSAQGLLFVTPEYNRSIPGVLKNAIDHASRPYGKSAFEGKPAAVMGASSGAPGTSMAQQHLRNIWRISTARPLASRKSSFTRGRDFLKKTAPSTTKRAASSCRRSSTSLSRG
jgi:chromate reductase